MKIRGKLKLQNGQLDGKGEIIYSDGTKMKAIFHHGEINGTFSFSFHLLKVLNISILLIIGKVMIYDKWKRLHSIGVYENGMPNGPFWIFSKNQNMLMYLQNGYLGSQSKSIVGQP